MKDVYLVSAARTPLGSFLGSLQTVPAPVLGSVVIEAVLTRAGVPKSAINEVLMGCVLPTGQGQAPARQAMIQAGLPESTGAVTINKVCGSGLKAVMIGAAEIRAGEADLVVAGGMENMSLTPFYLKDARNGFRMGHQTLIDSMIADGLWDPYHDLHMGNAAELCAEKYAFTREAQDAFALQSYQRARTALESGAFDAEVVPVPVPQRRGDPVLFTKDEEPYKSDLAKLGTLRAAFQPNGGTITAGNASTINDGAAALLLASPEAVEKYGLTPMARIVSSATHSQEPLWFTTAPVGAMQKALDKAAVPSIDSYEVNEAFAVVPMAAILELNLPAEKVNPRGGAVSLGHPIGASGARILVTLLHTLQPGQHGLASLCIGGGEAVAMVVERL